MGLVSVSTGTRAVLLRRSARAGSRGQPHVTGSVLSFLNASMSASVRGQLWEVELSLEAREGEPGGNTEQSVAQSFLLDRGELAIEREGLSPDDQVVRQRDDLDPHLVERERLERELCQPGVLVVADAVFDRAR
jgi:hypothetical protein